MKPIEPGCLAIVVGLSCQPEVNGMSVKVEYLEHAGHRFTDYLGDWSELTPGPPAWFCSHDSWKGLAPIMDKNLLRIDGDELVEQSDDLEVTA